MFPVQWQWFWRGEHPKYQVVQVDVTKHGKDQRPESHRPHFRHRLGLPRKSSSTQHAEVLNRLPQYRMCDLVAAKGWSRPSLGLVVPHVIEDFTWEDQFGDESQIKKMRRQHSRASSPRTLRSWSSVRSRSGTATAVTGVLRRAPPDHRRLGDLRGMAQVAGRLPERLPRPHQKQVDGAGRSGAVSSILRWQPATGATSVPRAWCRPRHPPTEPLSLAEGAEADPQRSSDDTSSDPPRSTEGRLFDLYPTIEATRSSASCPC